VHTRAFRHGFLLLALSAVAASAADLTIVRVFTGWRQAASFKRISEYFSGKENSGHETVLRTHAAQRAGYYFLVHAANPGAPTAVTIKVELIPPTDTKSRDFTFTTDLKSGETVLNLGLTGADWPDAKATPVAWKLTILTASDRVLATEKSYLWEKPASKEL